MIKKLMKNKKYNAKKALAQNFPHGDEQAVKKLKPRQIKPNKEKKFTLNYCFLSQICWL